MSLRSSTIIITNVIGLTRIILLFSEVEVGDMSAVNTVLRADVKRLKLLEEEQKLLAETDDNNSDRLLKVYEELQAIGADSAESRARRILAVRTSEFDNNKT